jgi:hypothetical protein
MNIVVDPVYKITVNASVKYTYSGHGTTIYSNVYLFCFFQIRVTIVLCGTLTSVCLPVAESLRSYCFWMLGLAQYPVSLCLKFTYISCCVMNKRWLRMEDKQKLSFLTAKLLLAWTRGPKTEIILSSYFRVVQSRNCWKSWCDLKHCYYHRET